MDRSIIAALVRSPALTTRHLPAAIDAVAAIAPQLLTEFAGRPDLDNGLRARLVTNAQTWQLTILLYTLPPDRDLVATAAQRAENIGPLIPYCGSRGWTDYAVALARRLDWQGVRLAVQQWEVEVGELPPELVTALVDAAYTTRQPRPDLRSMSEWEQRRWFDAQEEEQRERDAVAWSMLQHRPGLWLPHARDDEHGHVHRLLLDRPEVLPDDVLEACIPAILGTKLRGKPYLAGARLSIAADHVRRRPRLRDLAAAQLTDLVRDVVADGWTPREDHGFTDWKGIAAIAALSDAPEILAPALAAAVAGSPPPPYERPEHAESRRENVTAAVMALADNTAVNESDLVAVIPHLDEPSLAALLPHCTGPLHDACEVRLAQLQRNADAARPRIVPVPDDDALAHNANPEAELRTHLKYLKANAAQRDATVSGLLNSRFTTPQILRALPAADVLDGIGHTELVADMLITTCAVAESRWQRLTEQATSTPKKSVNRPGSDGGSTLEWRI